MSASKATATLTVKVQNIAQTEAWAAQLAGICTSGDCITLSGDLGVGKTCFARGFIQARAGADMEVVSPTFTLVQPYALLNGTMLWHFDLYRIAQAQELEEIGLTEALQLGIVLMEWPDIAAAYLPSVRLEVHITQDTDPQARTIRFDAFGEWAERLQEFERNHIP